MDNSVCHSESARNPSELGHVILFQQYPITRKIISKNPKFDSTLPAAGGILNLSAGHAFFGRNFGKVLIRPLEVARPAQETRAGLCDRVPGTALGSTGPKIFVTTG